MNILNCKTHFPYFKTCLFQLDLSGCVFFYLITIIIALKPILCEIHCILNLELIFNQPFLNFQVFIL